MVVVNAFRDWKDKPIVLAASVIFAVLRASTAGHQIVVPPLSTLEGSFRIPLNELFKVERSAMKAGIITPES